MCLQEVVIYHKSTQLFVRFDTLFFFQVTAVCCGLESVPLAMSEFTFTYLSNLTQPQPLTSATY